MKILVGYKRVVDYNVRIQVKPDGSGVVTDGVKLSPNPFDDIALEEALRLRDKGVATEVVVATIAPADAQAHLRNGLAMGANRAIHVVTERGHPAADRRPRPAQAGREGSSRRSGAPRQAGHRRRLPTRPARCSPPCGAARRPPSPRKLDVADGECRGASRARSTPAWRRSRSTCRRSITTDLRLNEPRFIKLPDIMKAKSQAARDARSSPSLGVESADHAQLHALRPAGQAQQGRDGQGRGGAGLRAEGQGAGVRTNRLPSPLAGSTTALRRPKVAGGG
jgi:electron transfer flavoprotein beta subunit